MSIAPPPDRLAAILQRHDIVMATLNGQLRPIQVRDRSVAVDLPAKEKADKNNPKHVAAPFAGVVTATVSEGDVVKAGDTVATIEAMKMETPLVSPFEGTVVRVHVAEGDRVAVGAVLVELEA